MSSSEPCLEACEVSCSVEGRFLLRGLSLRLVPGEVHAVLGRNGAGKSSLLRVLGGELQPQSGSVRLNGRALRDWTPRQLACRRAVLPQTEGLRFGFTAEQVVALGRYASARHRPDEERRLVHEALTRAGAAELAQRRYPSLSGGERARVQLARTLAQICEPPADAAPGEGARYLLLDEPTASLDLAHQHRCLQQVRRFAAEGVGVLAVLHDPNLALRYADRVTVLDGGRIAGQGPVLEVLSAALLTRTYGVGIELLRSAGEAVPVAVVHPAADAAAALRPAGPAP